MSEPIRTLQALKRALRMETSFWSSSQTEEEQAQVNELLDAAKRADAAEKSRDTLGHNLHKANQVIALVTARADKAEARVKALEDKLNTPGALD